MKIEYIGKCLYIESKEGKKILVVGDLHLGYEEVLNQAGVFVTRNMFNEMIKYFDRVFEKVGKVDYVILLGDVKHYFGKILRQEWNDVLRLFDYFEEKSNDDGKIVVVKGNHDIILEPIIRKRKRVVMRDFFVIDGVTFLHGDRNFKEIYDKKIEMWMMGHGHPAIKLSNGVRVEKYKCFLVGGFRGREVIIVPSFFDYSKGSDPRENDLGLAWDFDFKKFHVKIVGVEGDLGDLDFGVLDFGKLGKLK